MTVSTDYMDYIYIQITNKKQTMIRADNSSYIVNDYLIRFFKYLKLRNIFYEAAEYVFYCISEEVGPLSLPVL